MSGAFKIFTKNLSGLLQLTRSYNTTMIQNSVNCFHTILQNDNHFEVWGFSKSVIIDISLS